MDFSTLSIPEFKDVGVIVTGGSTGIGAEIVKAFASQGAKVGLHYNSSADAAEAVADEARSKGGKIELLQADANDPEALKAMIEEGAAKLGGLRGLINNAGGMVRRVAYEDVTDQDYDQIMDLNARSILVTSKAALPYLKEEGGFVIHTTSIAARNGASGGAGLYGSSKAFVSNVTRGMAKEWIQYGVRVNAVAPGVITTAFHERHSTQAQMDASLATIPQGRLGVASDCVGAFLFLASDLLSGYVIGQTIEVNGGQLMP